MESKVPSQLPVDGLKKWSGYTLDDLRYQRAVNHVKMEMERERLASATRQFVDRKQSAFAGGMMRKMFTGFTVIDYALLAFQATKQIRKIYRLFKK